RRRPAACPAVCPSDVLFFPRILDTCRNDKKRHYHIQQSAKIPQDQHHTSCSSFAGSKFNDPCRDLLAERPVVLDKEHCGLKGEQQILELHPGEDIDKVQRLIPEKEVCRLAQRFCQEHLFLLSLAVVLDPFFKLCAFQPEFPQDSEEQRFADAASDSKLREGAAQVRGVLGDI